MFIKGMMGLGDCIYARAFVRRIKGVYLETPWPELYADLDVKPVCPSTHLRTQTKNIERVTHWHQAPEEPKFQIAYGKLPVMQGLERSYGFAPGKLDLPDFGQPPVSGDYVLVRPVTVRAEWRADARNPKPEYIYKAATVMRERGYKIVSVADLEDGKEWALDPLPQADVVYHKGELSVSELMALTQNAKAIIGGIGWIVPASIAARVPAFIVCGGQGGFNSPAHITEGLDASNIKFAVPDNFCYCTKKEHDCDKEIKDYEEKITEWAGRFPVVE